MLIGALILLDVSAFAHPNGAEAGAPGAALWSFEPLVTVALLVTGSFYLVGAVRRWRRRSLARSEALSFAAGWLTLVIALVSPVHKLGEWLFSVHMTQHELLITVAAPLLVLSRRWSRSGGECRPDIGRRSAAGPSTLPSQPRGAR